MVIKPVQGGVIARRFKSGTVSASTPILLGADLLISTVDSKGKRFWPLKRATSVPYSVSMTGNLYGNIESWQTRNKADFWPSKFSEIDGSTNQPDGSYEAMKPRIYRLFSKQP